MFKRIRITESQIDSVIRSRILNELGGQKGLWKEEWDKEDQMLAMYNSLYGIEELGMSKQEVAEKIIGSSLGSLAQQTSNFDFRHTGKGLGRPSPFQDEIYAEFKDMPREEFKQICQQIIDHRLENPPEAVTKKEIGSKIGDKRDSIEKERADALRNKGIKDPSRFKLVSSRPADIPNDEEGDVEPSSEIPNPTSKDEIKDFLSKLIDRLSNAESKEEIQNLVGDLNFLNDYIDSEWPDGETENLVAEVKRIYYKKTIPEISRMLNVMGYEKNY